MIVIRVFLLALFLFIFPVMMGMSWTKILPKKNRCRIYACFPIGFFVELAIFQLIVVPMAFLHLPFTLMCWVFAGVVVIYSIWSVVGSIKKPPFRIKMPRLSRWELFYLFVFLVLLSLQMYNGFTRDTTYWSYDDATYVTYAADTIRYNAVQTINPDTGIAQAFNGQRAIQTSLYFPAFLSILSSVPVTVMERTILETYNIFLAYIVYAYMASVVYKKMENGLIFVIILCFVNIYGWYSQYSVTFRLLGPNYQGKAVLAASFSPLLFTLYIQMIEQKYVATFGRLLLLLSVTATSFTLFGAVTIMVNTFLVVVLYNILKKRWKQLLYIPWSCIMPTFYICMYFVYKYAIL